MSVLDEIIGGVREDLQQRKNEVPLHEIKARAQEASEPLDVIPSFIGHSFNVIAEIKRSSPSKGELAPIADPATLALQYQSAGACAVSVLTESRRFKGSLADLQVVRRAIDIPILRKEFIVDDYQIYEARAYGADIILLIVAALSDDEIKNFSELTHSLGMRTLIEVHDELELNRVLSLYKKRGLAIDLLGINARNLKTLSIDSTIFESLAGYVPNEIPLIAESGISSIEQVIALRTAGASGILVGETLVKDGDPGRTIKDFLHLANTSNFRRLSP